MAQDPILGPIFPRGVLGRCAKILFFLGEGQGMKIFQKFFAVRFRWLKQPQKMIFRPIVSSMLALRANIEPRYRKASPD